MRIGEKQRLRVVRKTDFGIYLAAREGDRDMVLLPAKEVPQGTSPGDEMEVFVYRDSKDRPIATTRTPRILLGQAGVLTVKEVGRIGAFLDWGLEKDRFLPYKEMTKKVKAGDEILVRVYLDKSGRLCASMKGLYDLLSTASPYRVGDEVTGRVYEFGHDLGIFIAVDDKYSAMIPRHEDVSGLTIGQRISARVTNVKEDGKLDITIRQKAYLQMDEDAKALLELLDSYAGVFPFTEKASPEVILRETGLSKNAFKRAIGRLYRERLVEINDGKIRKRG